MWKNSFSCKCLSSMDPMRILETEGDFPLLEHFCESWRTAKHHLQMPWPMGAGYKSASSLHCLGEHLCFIPSSINRLCFWVGKLHHISNLHLISQLGEVGKDESQFLSLQGERSTSEGHHHRSQMAEESLCQCSACAQPPALTSRWRKRRSLSL